MNSKVAELQPAFDSKLQELDLAINTIVVDSGVPALAVADASGSTQQDINDFGGAKWRNKAGGYALGATVKLDNGDTVKSTIAANKNNPNVDMTGWVNHEKDQKTRNAKVLYVSDFGIKGDGTDEAAKLQLAVNNLQPSKVLDLEGLTITCDAQVTITAKKKFGLKNGQVKKKNGSQTNTENRALMLDRCDGFVIDLLDVDGNRDNRALQETAVHTVSMRECQNGIILNSSFINGACDNLHFDSRTPLDKNTHTKNLWFINCKLDNSYRNNASLIVAQHIRFTMCSFTNANGTLPMAGVDIETNAYGGDALVNHIVFDDCTLSGNFGWQLLVTQHDSPRNIRVIGGRISAPNVSVKSLLNNKLVPIGTDGSTTLPNASNTGGVQITNPDTVFHGTVFEDFPVGSGAALRIGANAGAFASLLGCKFRNILNTGYQAITTHVLSDGIYLDNRCEFYQCSTGLSLNGKSNKLHNSVFNGCGLIYSGAAGGFVELSNNTMSNGTGDRFIYLESIGSVIKDNRLLDLLHASPVAYIQSEAVGSVVDKNRCSATTAQTTTVGIRFNATNGKSLQDNECVNLHSTAPFSIINTVLNKAVIARNIGNTAKIDTPIALRGFSTAQRPAATAVNAYSSIFDITLKKVLTSDGTNWYDQSGAIVT